jgi:uncharacterized UPF0160 family protein
MHHIAKKAKLSHVSMASMVETLRGSKIVSTLQAVENLPKEQLIGTHNGSFHCDEALAVSMLKILPQYAGATVVRTRDPELLAKCGIVVDVGAVYDAATHRYDHHQREFTGVLDGYNTKLSSAGLVYKHFGKDIIRELLKDDESCTPDFVDICFHKLYTNFIEHVDAIDNGVSVAEGPAKYYVSTTLSARVGHLNPAWNAPQSADIYNDNFKSAMELTCTEFVSAAQSLASSWWPARSIVQKAMNERFDVHESGSIIILSQACPWKDHLFEIDDSGKQVLYALYQDTGGSWRIQAVPQDPQSFLSRKKLPDVWCGLRDDVLSKASGEPGAIFIHASGFIGGHANKEGALNMAIKALSLP